MRRYGCMLLGAAMVVAICGAAGAASEQAMKLRSQNGLSEFAPPEAFLAGNFLADETDPAFIFGKVRDFTKSLACPATWLIEEGERKRIEARGQSVGPGRVFHLPGGGLPGQGHLLHLRRPVLQFRPVAGMAPAIPRKTKADPHYKEAKASLDQAAQNGFAVDAELRFVALNGDLLLKRPEDILTGELKFQPIYDLKKNQALSK